MDSITQQQLLEIICVFWNGYSLWVCQSGMGFLFGFLEVTIGIMIVLDGHNDAESNSGCLDLQDAFAVLLSLTSRPFPRHSEVH